MPEKQKVSDQIKNEFAKTQYYRDTKNAALGGVIAGLAKYTGWEVTPLRILFVLLLIFTAFVPLAIAYLIVWICAPDKPMAKTKYADVKQAETVNTKTDEAQPSNPKNTTSLILRVVLMVFGIIGFCTFIPLLISIIPIIIISTIAIANATIVEPPLFIATVVMMGILFITIISIGLHISTALVTAKFGRGSVITLIVNVIIATSLSIAATTTGAIWLSRVGKDGIESTFNSIVDDANVNINLPNDGRVQIDIGPIHIRTN